MDFNQKYNEYLDYINSALDKYVILKQTPEKTIYQAMNYSLKAGGKRLRPVLALAAGELFGGRKEEIIAYACAIEMIHTYSLIHDDLPAMDNDDYRRGKLTNHKVYGEATAILAGDALLNHAMEIVLKDMLMSLNGRISAENRLKAANIIFESSGTAGMIGGQVIDLESEGVAISRELLEYMHKCKTGALIKAPVLAAAALLGADSDEYGVLEHFSEKLGLAFQIKDDILDVEGDSATLGKRTGSDTANKKSTYVSILGLQEAKRLLSDITNEAIKLIGDKFGDKAAFLQSLAEYLIIREN